MSETHAGFSPDQIQAMRAARPLAGLIAEATLGYDVWAGHSREIVIPSISSDSTIISLEAPETTGPLPFGETWQPILRGEKFAAYHRLQVISTGNICVTKGRRQYEINQTYIIDRPEDEALHNLGLVVMQPLYLQSVENPQSVSPDQLIETLVASRTGDCRTLDVVGVQALLQTVRLALEADNV